MKTFFFPHKREKERKENLFAWEKISQCSLVWEDSYEKMW